MPEVIFLDNFSMPVWKLGFSSINNPSDLIEYACDKNIINQKIK